MQFENKKVLIVGMAKSGVSAAIALNKLKADITVNDIKTEEELTDAISELKEIRLHKYFGIKPDELVIGKDLIVISPGIPIESPFVEKAKKLNVPVISEIELGYILMRGTLVGITGTNGKTTTTSLTGEILKNAGRNTYVTGNIGVPITSKALDTVDTDLTVAEISSFQLEGIKKFRPNISVILNITEDHMNRHKTMENYTALKARIFENQSNDDITILNADDSITFSLGKNAKCKVLYFSRKSEVENGCFVKDGNIVFKMDDKYEVICKADELRIPGKHNLENALAAATVACSLNISSDVIRSTFMTFRGVEHRIEFVEEINGVQYINDSKGTNPDAAIKAIDSMKRPTVLIAGGFDKGSDFSVFVDNFNGKIKALVLIGETAEKIKETAENKGFNNIFRVKTLDDAVKKSAEISSNGDAVLLSPACASWDMFKNFEERGNQFKQAVHNLRR